MNTLLVVLLLTSTAAFAQNVITPVAPGKTPSLTVSWTETTPNCATFNIYRATTPGGENYGQPLSSVVGTVSSYTDKSVLPGIFYYYTVTAVVVVESAPSNEVSMQVPVPPSPPLATIKTP